VVGCCEHGDELCCWFYKIGGSGMNVSAAVSFSRRAYLHKDVTLNLSLITSECSPCW